MESSFRIDVYNAAGVRQNGSTIYVSDVVLIEAASRIGTLSFVVPTQIAMEQGFAFGMRYRLYHEAYGYLGEFKHDTENIDAAGQISTITANNELWKLNDVLVGFNWAWADAAIAGIFGVLSSMVGLAGMSMVYVGPTTYYQFSGTFNGQTAFTAVDSIRKQQRAFFALNAPGVVRFGRFLDPSTVSSSVVLSNSSLAGDVDDGSSVLPITALRVIGEAGNVVNRLIPRGAGSGEAQLDLRYSNRTTPYTIQSRGNRDGLNTLGANDAGAATRMYYIEDATSIAAYGAVERVISLNDIAPVTNSIADRKNAANALYDVAVAYLTQFKNPTRNYEVECANLPSALRPGDVVIMDYRGIVETDSGRKVALRITMQKFYILDIERKFQGKTTICKLTVSSNGEEASDALDVFSNILRDVDRLKLQPQPTLTYYSRNGGERPVKNALNYDFVFNLGDDVLELNAMKCVFRTMPLRANAANNTGSGGGTTATSSSGGSGPPTSSSGGGTTATSSSGGSSAPTSSAGSSDHTHGILIRKTPAGATFPMSVDSGVNLVAPTLASDVTSATQGQSTTHTHSVTVPAHTHDVVITNHTHTVTVPAHTHDVTVPNHTHTLTFGVIEDTALPTNLRIFLDATEITSIVNQSTGAAGAYPISTAGWWSVDLLATLLAMSDWHGNHTLSFQCASGQGAIFAEIQGRVTIQAIKVG